MEHIFVFYLTYRSDIASLKMSMEEWEVQERTEKQTKHNDTKFIFHVCFCVF